MQRSCEFEGFKGKMKGFLLKKIKKGLVIHGKKCYSAKEIHKTYQNNRKYRLKEICIFLSRLYLSAEGDQL